MDEWSSTAKDKHDPDDQERVWRSFKGSGVTIGTLFHYARHGGWMRNGAGSMQLQGLRPISRQAMKSQGC
jgi:Primase C terminal 2 (PriCT-2)